jgi:hypothetical protein
MTEKLDDIEKVVGSAPTAQDTKMADAMVAIITKLYTIRPADIARLDLGLAMMLEALRPMLKHMAKGKDEPGNEPPAKAEPVAEGADKADG